MNRATSFLIVMLLLSVSGCSGPTFAGFVNDNVRYNTHTLTDDIAQTLVQLHSAPQISDEELQRLYEAIHARAMEGNPEAALVLLTIATLQRQPASQTNASP